MTEENIAVHGTALTAAWFNVNAATMYPQLINIYFSDFFSNSEIIANAIAAQPKPANKPA